MNDKDFIELLDEAYIIGYYNAKEETTTIIKESKEKLDEIIKSEKQRAIDEALNEISIKYAKNTKVIKAINKIGKWIEENKYAISIVAFTSIYQLIVSSHQNIDILLDIAAIIGIGGSVYAIQKKLINRANDIKKE